MGAFMTNENFTREVLMGGKYVFGHVFLMIYCYQISIDVDVRDSKMYFGTSQSTFLLTAIETFSTRR